MMPNEKLWYISVVVMKRYYPRFYAFSISSISSFPFCFSPSAAALKTQPYDLLRWSAAYFRCLSMDVLPPVKPRYEHENVFGCLTKGYLKVLLSQVRKGEVGGSKAKAVMLCSIFSMPLSDSRCLSPIIAFNYDSCLSIYMMLFCVFHFLSCPAYDPNFPWQNDFVFTMKFPSLFCA